MRLRALTIAAMLGIAATAAQAAPVQWTTASGGNGHWYEAVAVPAGVTWTAAQANAVTRGGYLATILSAAENGFVFALIDSTSYWVLESPGQSANLGPWLGGHQEPASAEPAGGWYWENGEGAFGFTSWLAGEPTNGVGSPHGLTEDRLHYFQYGGRSSTWNDFPDSAPTRPIAYVIEYNSSPVPEPSSLALLALGVAGLAATRRRKQ